MELEFLFLVFVKKISKKNDWSHHIRSLKVNFFSFLELDEFSPNNSFLTLFRCMCGGLVNVGTTAYLHLSTSNENFGPRVRARFHPFNFLGTRDAHFVFDIRHARG